MLTRELFAVANILASYCRYAKAILLLAVLVSHFRARQSKRVIEIITVNTVIINVIIMFLPRKILFTATASGRCAFGSSSVSLFVFDISVSLT